MHTLLISRPTNGYGGCIGSSTRGCSRSYLVRGDAGVHAWRRQRKRTALKRVPKSTITVANLQCTFEIVGVVPAYWRRYRQLTFVDKAKRKCLLMKVDCLVAAKYTIAAMDRLERSPSCDPSIACEHGPKICSEGSTNWLARRGIKPGIMDAWRQYHTSVRPYG